MKSTFSHLLQLEPIIFQATADLEATTTADAIYQYHRRTNQFPQALDELLGAYLANLPIDQFNGQPRQYRVLDRDFILYTIGQDGIDQEGQPKMTTWDTPSHAPKVPQSLKRPVNS